MNDFDVVRTHVDVCMSAYTMQHTATYTRMYIYTSTYIHVYVHIHT